MNRHSMRLDFTLPCKAFSVNAYYYRTRSIKTKEAKIWEAQILELLEEHKLLHDMALRFNELGGAFRINIIIQYPHHIFFNKQGQISAKTFDVTNTEKPLLDLIINRFMNLDDRYVLECCSSKQAGANHAIKVILEHINFSSDQL